MQNLCHLSRAFASRYLDLYQPSSTFAGRKKYMQDFHQRSRTFVKCYLCFQDPYQLSRTIAGHYLCFQNLYEPLREGSLHELLKDARSLHDPL